MLWLRKEHWFVMITQHFRCCLIWLNFNLLLLTFFNMFICSRPRLTWLTHLSLTVENKSISFKCPHTACLTVRALSGSQWNRQSLHCCLLSWLEYRDRLHKTFTLNALLSRILNYPSKITCPFWVILLTTYQTLSVVRFCGIHTSSVNLRSIYH